MQRSGDLIALSYIANGHGSSGNPLVPAPGRPPMNRSNAGIPGGAPLSQLETPAQTILVMENSGTTSAGESTFSIESLQGDNTDFTNHLGTTNILFTDGHVKALKPITLATTSPALNSFAVNATSVPPTNLLGILATEQARLDK
jgi:prepilin-type processing-associated H-X9-DG protein